MATARSPFKRQSLPHAASQRRFPSQPRQRPEAAPAPQGIVSSLTAITKDAESAAKMYEAANALALQSIGKLDRFVRKINNGFYQKQLLSQKEIIDIRQTIKKLKVTCKDNAFLTPQILLIHAMFEEKLGTVQHQENALNMYKVIEAKYPEFRKAFSYHAFLLLQMDRKQECEAVLLSFNPTLAEIARFPRPLKDVVTELGQQAEDSDLSSSSSPVVSPKLPPLSSGDVPIKGVGSSQTMYPRAGAASQQQQLTSSGRFAPLATEDAISGPEDHLSQSRGRLGGSH